MDTKKRFVTDVVSIYDVKWDTKGLLNCYLGKGVISKMASKMSVGILHWMYLNDNSI